MQEADVENGTKIITPKHIWLPSPVEIHGYENKCSTSNCHIIYSQEHSVQK